MNNFWRPVKLNHYFLYIRKWFSNLYPALFDKKINMKFQLASLKTLTNSKISSKKSRIKFMLCLFHWSIFCSEHSRPAIGTIFGITGCFRNSLESQGSLSESRNKIPEEGFLKVFILHKRFHSSKKKLILDFLHNKTAKKCENHQRSFKNI